MAIAWDNMLPGEVYSATATYRNDGTVPQDVYVVFPNKTALSALNSLGTYGAVRLTSTDGASFYSNNLNDHPIDQGAVCKMLPEYVLLASNIRPNDSGSMTFRFQYASKMGDIAFNNDGSVKRPASSGSAFSFNTFPVVKPGGALDPNYEFDGNLAGYDQRYVIPGQTGTGLPYEIVALQHGVVPGQLGTDAGF